MAQLVVPQALLLDFGGVVFTTRKRPGGIAQLAREARDLLVQHGQAELDETMVLEDIESGLAAWKAWKNAKSRPYAPRDVSHEEFWEDFVAADWPEASREVVVKRAFELCYRLGILEAERAVRPSAIELLAYAHDHGIGVGIVSNALCGQVHREAAAEAGIERYLGAQIYSDEHLIRKPNPEMLHLAARELGVPIARCWYVGDNFDRDVLCGRRAGVGSAILMVDQETYEIPYKVRVEPDLVVQDPGELLAVLEHSLRATNSLEVA
jgi:HAD superfamily hydrolase (TIGR01549 family)